MEKMIDYIRSIPELIKNNSNDTNLTSDLEEVLYKNSGRLVLVASGSSNNACMTIKYLLRDLLDRYVEVFSPSIFENYEIENYIDDLVVVISQGGKSTNCIRLLNTMKNKGMNTVVITSDKNSPISKYSDILIDYQIGIETVGYVTRGYVGLVLYLILAALNISDNEFCKLNKESFKNDLNDANDIFDDIYKRSFDMYELYKKDFLSNSVVHVVSSGDSLGTAKEAALKIGETVKIPSFAYDMEEYIHGPNLQLDPSYTVFLIDNLDNTSARLEKLFYALKEVTDDVYMITSKNINDSKVFKIKYENKISRLLFNVIPFQLLAYNETEQLGKWDDHPLMEKFDEIIDSKIR